MGGGGDGRERGKAKNKGEGKRDRVGNSYSKSAHTQSSLGWWLYNVGKNKSRMGWCTMLVEKSRMGWCTLLVGKK